MSGPERREKELDELAAKYGFTRVPGHSKNGRIKYTKGSSIVFASKTNHDRKALENLEGEFRRRR